MKLAALCMCGTLLVLSNFSKTTANPGEGAIYWNKGHEGCPVSLKLSGPCGGEGQDEDMCPYQVNLPPLFVHLPKQFGELEKTLREVRKLKETIDKLKKACHECTLEREEEKREIVWGNEKGGKGGNKGEIDCVKANDAGRMEKEEEINQLEAGNTTAEESPDLQKKRKNQEREKNKWESEKEPENIREKEIIKVEGEKEGKPESGESEIKHLWESEVQPGRETDSHGEKVQRTGGDGKSAEGWKKNIQDRKEKASQDDNQEGKQHQLEEEIQGKVIIDKDKEEQVNEMQVHHPRQGKNETGWKEERKKPIEQHKHMEKKKGQQQKERVAKSNGERDNDKEKQVEDLVRTEKDKATKIEEDSIEAGNEMKNIKEKTGPSVQIDSGGELVSSKPSEGMTDIVSPSPWVFPTPSSGPWPDSIMLEESVTTALPSLSDARTSNVIYTNSGSGVIRSQETSTNYGSRTTSVPNSNFLSSTKVSTSSSTNSITGLALPSPEDISDPSLNVDQNLRSISSGAGPTQIPSLRQEQTLSGKTLSTLSFGGGIHQITTAKTPSYTLANWPTTTKKTVRYENMTPGQTMKKPRPRTRYVNKARIRPTATLPTPAGLLERIFTNNSSFRPAPITNVDRQGTVKHVSTISIHHKQTTIQTTSSPKPQHGTLSPGSSLSEPATRIFQPDQHKQHGPESKPKITKNKDTSRPGIKPKYIVTSSKILISNYSTNNPSLDTTTTANSKSRRPGTRTSSTPATFHSRASISSSPNMLIPTDPSPTTTRQGDSFNTWTTTIKIYLPETHQTPLITTAFSSHRSGKTSPSSKSKSGAVSFLGNGPKPGKKPKLNLKKEPDQKLRPKQNSTAPNNELLDRIKFESEPEPKHTELKPKLKSDHRPVLNKTLADKCDQKSISDKDPEPDQKQNPKPEQKPSFNQMPISTHQMPTLDRETFEKPLPVLKSKYEPRPFHKPDHKATHTKGPNFDKDLKFEPSKNLKPETNQKSVSESKPGAKSSPRPWINPSTGAQHKPYQKPTTILKPIPVVKSKNKSTTSLHSSSVPLTTLKSVHLSSTETTDKPHHFKKITKTRPSQRTIHTTSSPRRGPTWNPRTTPAHFLRTSYVNSHLATTRPSVNNLNPKTMNRQITQHYELRATTSPTKETSTTLNSNLFGESKISTELSLHTGIVTSSDLSLQSQVNLHKKHTTISKHKLSQSSFRQPIWSSSYETVTSPMVRSPLSPTMTTFHSPDAPTPSPISDSSTPSARELRVKTIQVAANLNNTQGTLGGKLERHKKAQSKEDTEVQQKGNKVNKTESQHLRPAQTSSEVTRTPKDCSDHVGRGGKKTGLYLATPDPRNGTFSVVCDMDLHGGGWTILQLRQDGSVSFNRSWADYRMGFGQLKGGEFWLGNDKIHLLTRSRDMVLRIELEDFDGVKQYAEYGKFRVASERMRYRLSVGGYSGSAGDALHFSRRYDHNNRAFTTPDRDHDRYPSGNCGAYYSSGWWFDACMAANLNGKYYMEKYKGVRNGIYWGTWHNISEEYYPTNYRLAFKAVRMMIRPKSFAP